MLAGLLASIKNLLKGSASLACSLAAIKNLGMEFQAQGTKRPHEGSIKNPKPQKKIAREVGGNTSNASAPGVGNGTAHMHLGPPPPLVRARRAPLNKLYTGGPVRHLYVPLKN